MPYLSRDGIRLHWRADGPQDAPAVLCLNSLGTDLRLWDAVTARLPDMRVIRMDTRGHGASDAPPGPYALETLMADAGALIDHLGLARVSVMGVSLGGMMAQALALARPDQVERVVLSNTAMRMGTPESWAARIDAVNAGGLGAIADAILDRWFAPPYRHAPEMAAWHAMLLATPAQGYVGCCAALAGADLSARSPAIACPALVIAGGADAASPPAQVAPLAQVIARARYVELPGIGHLPMAEAPETFAALVRDFLQGTIHD